MAKPTTRSTFKTYCLRELGFPVIDINVDDDQLEDRIDEALKDAKDRMEKKGKKEEKKDAMGGKGDKFEAEPQMTSLVNDKQ